MRFCFIIALLFGIFTGLSAQDDPTFEQGVLHFEKGNKFKSDYKPDSALFHFNKAAEFFKSEKYTNSFIKAKYSAASVLIMLSEYEKAEAVFDEIQPLAEKEFGKENKLMMHIYFGRGNLDFYLGKTRNAINYYEKSLALSEKLLDEKNLFSTQIYGAMGNAYSVNGQYKTALENYNRDLRIRVAVLGKEHPSLTQAYNNISLAYRETGELAKAEEYIDRAIKINTEHYGEKHPETALYYSNKGNICFKKGQLDLALEYFNRAVDINEKIYGQNHKRIADDLNSIGIVYKEKGEHERALVAFKDAYAIQKVIYGDAPHPEIAGTSNNIAFALDSQGKAQSALTYYREAIDITRQVFGKNHQQLAAFYNNIGISYANQKNEEKALENYKRAADIYRYNFGDAHFSLIEVYNNIAEVYQKKSELDSALLFYQKSLASNSEKFKADSLNLHINPPVAACSDSRKLLETLTGKAKTYGFMYMRDSLIEHAEYAHSAYLSCDTAATKARQTVEKQSDKISLAEQTKKIYENALINAVELSYNAEKKRRREQYKLDAFYFSEKNKASVLADAVRASDAKDFAGLPPEVTKAEQQLKLQIADLELKITESKDTKEIERLQAELFKTNRQLEDLNRQIEEKYPKYFRSKYESSFISVKDLQKELEDNEALRSYFLGRDDIIIFHITNDELTVISQDKPEAFDQSIKDYIGLATSGLPRDFPILAKKALSLYNLLFPEQQDKKTEKLIIIPDGILGMLPFESLFTEEYSGDYKKFKKYPFLIKQKQISYYFSSYLFYKAQTDKNNYRNQQDWLGVAPVFSNITNRQINGINVTELPGTKSEINAIDSLYRTMGKSTKVLIENQASKSNLFKQKPEGYRVLHIATHGIVNPEFPKQSGILLHPERNKSEGMLYSAEIYNMKLKADLTVLSACETGIGKVSKSEGVIGLSRALLYAGAGNIIVSMWKVSDSSTSDLMINFYKNVLQENMSYSEALHTAKLKMIKGGGNYAHPFFWSPFILIGR